MPNVGKSTLFNAVTRTRKAEAANYPFCTIDPNVGIVTVPDERMYVLQGIAKTTVVIPAAIPTVLSGLRVGGALVIVGVVVSEMLISSAGIGYLISRYRTILDSPHVFAGVLLVLALAVAFNTALKWIERKAAIWQTGTRGAQGATEDIASHALQPAS